MMCDGEGRLMVERIQCLERLLPLRLRFGGGGITPLKRGNPSVFAGNVGPQK